jgi:mono/diheme cytochrome c family protein
MGSARRAERRVRWGAIAAGGAALLLGILAACDASPAASTDTPAPTSAQLNEHAAQGQAKYLVAGCAACHGERAEGGIGPRSSGTTLRLEDVQLLMRSGEMDGVKYDYDELTDQDVANIYLWLQTNPAG